MSYTSVDAVDDIFQRAIDTGAIAKADAVDREMGEWNHALCGTAVETALLQRQKLAALARHVLGMADDAYLTGHPEWNEIAAEALRALESGMPS